MFDQIAAIYDVTNRAMSLGLDQKWRGYMIDKLWRQLVGNFNPASDDTLTVLDLATGTADVGIGIIQHSKLNGGISTKVIGVDPSREMLRYGQKKIDELKLEDSFKLNSESPPEKSSDSPIISLRVGDAQNLKDTANSIPDSSIHAVTMSFGIRNVPNRYKALAEMYRVLQPNREINILEFNLPDDTASFSPFLSRLFSKLARIFITHVIPGIGLVTTLGRGSAEYDYFQDSIADFPHWKDFSRLLTVSGFEVQEVVHFAFGAVQYYRAKKI